MDAIKQLISDNKLNEAISLLDEYIKSHPESDNALFLRGNAYRKKEMFREAMNDYLSAMSLNPNSPAAIAYRQTVSIMEFYNKDLYNP